jgi:hypothetical protein
MTVIGIRARGDGAAAVAKTRRVIGGFGLVVAPVTGFLTLLALGTDPAVASRFLLVTLVAMAAWAQGIAAQVGLSFRAAFTWLVTLALCAVVVLAIGGLLVTVLVDGLGWESRTGTRLAFLAVFGLIGIVLAAWAGSRPDRRALPGSVGRAAFGRAGPGDVELLAAGPRPLLRRRPIATR